MIKIDFEVETNYGKYRDALYLPENHGMTGEQIEAMKQERVDNWIDAVENPPQPVESNTEENSAE